MPDTVMDKRGRSLLHVLTLLLLFLGGACTVVSDRSPPEEEVPPEDDDDEQAPTYRDYDGDGFTEDQDCDETSPYIHPNADEGCGDDVDQDCSGDPDDGSEDHDGDGHVYALCTGGTDCNDLLADVNPDAVEVPYDGIDQDCSGADLTDVDGDGYDGHEAGGFDCDDGDSTIHPGAVQDCEDDTDQDCDGHTGYFDDDCCNLWCYCAAGELASGLSCGGGSGAMVYTYHYYPNGSIASIDYEYPNDVTYSCYFEYNGFGQVTEFSCVTAYGGGQTCSGTC